MVDVKDWLGREQLSEDIIEVGLVERMAATLSMDAPKSGEALPPLWLWAFFQPSVKAQGIGHDGHPARGGFLPPADNRNRMWAGGSMRFDHPLIIGEKAKRVSTIRKIEEKQGRSGALLFVSVEHDYQQNGKTAVLEMQNLVYREPSKPKMLSSTPCVKGEWAETIVPDPVLLFRYSAVTFNSHRIHYDYPYTTAQEGYPDLVVQGQLIATLNIAAFCRAHPDADVKQYQYQSQRPILLPQHFMLTGKIAEQGKATLWAGNDDGLAQSGEVIFTMKET